MVRVRYCGWAAPHVALAEWTELEMARRHLLRIQNRFRPFHAREWFMMQTLLQEFDRCFEDQTGEKAFEHFSRGNDTGGIGTGIPLAKMTSTIDIKSATPSPATEGRDDD